MRSCARSLCGETAAVLVAGYGYCAGHALPYPASTWNTLGLTADGAEPSVDADRSLCYATRDENGEIPGEGW